jgi:hypothetical protein
MVIGRTISWFPVISKIISTAVMAVPVLPPSIAPLPAIANAGALNGAPRSMIPTMEDHAAPGVAPTNSDGEKPDTKPVRRGHGLWLCSMLRAFGGRKHDLTIVAFHRCTN